MNDAPSPSLDAAPNALKNLNSFGQSPWLDFIRRSFLEDGGLARLVAQDGLGGVTSNPAIFEKAMTGGEYAAQFAALAADGSLDAGAIYETMAVADIQQAADILRPVYDRTGGADGFVSLEVSPYLAHDTQATLDEARRLWAWVDRPNLMIKVPGTPEGAVAIRALIEAGLNVNVTLLFALDAYQAVAEAFLAGLEARLARGLPIDRVASVASFFISRIDVAIDAQIDARVTAGDARAAGLKALRSKVATACAKQAYAWFQGEIAGPRWQNLAAHGARPQRLLWASTGTKDKTLSDVLYVEGLIGPDTVNTMPPATMDAFRDHGVASASLTDAPAAAADTLAQAAELGLDLPSVTAKLVADGVRAFEAAADALLLAIAQKRAALLRASLSGLSYALPAPLAAGVAAELEKWRGAGTLRRLWARDAAVWTGADEAKWLAWLEVVAERTENLAELTGFAGDVRARGFAHVLLLGMGGSSLGPEVLGRTFGAAPGFPTLHVLDSTDPQQVAAFEAAVDLASTLVIVASKSGGTLEPNILQAYFFDRMVAAVGAGEAGGHFVAITDPDSHMQRVAEGRKFWRIFYGDPQIGGRYSVLSNFGLVPAAAIGVNIAAMLAAANRMVQACSRLTPPAANPGVQLGAILAVAGRAGIDKVTLLAAPAIAALGAWMEQLIAESTGKQGRGIIPFDGEPLAAPEAYGSDRIFAYLYIKDAEDAAQQAGVAALEAAGFPVVRCALNSRLEIAQQFFLWEFATAVACAVLGIDAFNQPDVEASKIETRKLTDAFNKTGELAAEAPFAVLDGLKFFADAANIAALPADDLAGLLRAHLARAQAGDYVALLAYIEQNPAHEAALHDLQNRVRALTRCATAAQFGPRFLHSTGQDYKGGPNSGVFLQITADDAADLAIPGERYSFGIVKAAQARGDFEVLLERTRRALRVHLGADVAAGLRQLRAALG